MKFQIGSIRSFVASVTAVSFTALSIAPVSTWSQTTAPTLEPSAELVKEAEHALRSDLETELSRLPLEFLELPPALENLRPKPKAPVAGPPANAATVPTVNERRLFDEMDRYIESLNAEGVPLETSEQELKAAVDELTEVLKDEKGAEIAIKNRTGLIARAAAAGHLSEIRKVMGEIVQRLRIPGDPTEYKIILTPSFIPNASIERDNAVMRINIGLIAWTKNVDELAAVIAHEMTHGNKALLKATESASDIEAIIRALPSYGDLESAQREEIRADLGAIYRLIRAGYNPWAHYDFQKRFTQFANKNIDDHIMRYIYKIMFKQDMAALSTHPAGELRMAAAKAYIVKLAHQRDLADSVGKYQAYGLNMKMAQLRFGLITKPLMSIWVQRAMLAYAGYSVYDTHYTQELLRWSMTSVASSATPLASKAVEQFFTYGLMAMTVTMTGLMTSILYMATLHSDPNYQRFTEAKALMKELRELIRDTKMPSLKRLDRIMDIHRKIAVTLEQVFTRPGAIKTFSYIDGAELLRMRVHSTTLESLNLVETRMKSPGLLKHSLRYFENMPGFVFEAPSIQRKVRQVYSSLLTTTDPLTFTLQDSSRRQGESRLAWRMRLVSSLRAIQNGENPALKIALGYALAQEGLRDSALKLVGPWSRDLVNFATSRENKDPDLTRRLIETMNILKTDQSLGRRGNIVNNVQDVLLAMDTEVQRLKSTEDGITRFTVNQKAHKAEWSYFNLRGRLDKMNSKTIKKQAQQEFTSITGFVEMVETKIKDRNAPVEALSYLAMEIVSEKPEWVRSEQDLRLLYDTEYLWPKSRMVSQGPTPLETYLMHHMGRMAQRFPDVWKYDPGSSERLQKAYIAGVKKLGLMPKDYAARVAFWHKLTKRGVTSFTDAMFSELYEEASEKQKPELEKYAIDEGRVWEQEIKGKIARKRLNEFKPLSRLKGLPVTATNEREAALALTLKEVEKYLPERGRVYVEILEEISVVIESTPEESSKIHKAKTGNQRGGEVQEDLATRLFSSLLEEGLRWKHADQWDLIQFLRGDAPASKKVEDAFQRVGTERVRRMFELLPTLGRHALLSSFLDAPRGLLGGNWKTSRNMDRILDHLFRGQDPERVRVAREVLESFLFALKKTGNGALRADVIAYLLAQEKSANSDSALILKNVLEVFGATGVKIGQFLAISQVLPKREAEILRMLQDRAKHPDREAVYNELREILETKDLPFQLRGLLGAASMKYVMLGRENLTMEDIVIKVFRLESIAHTRQEFNLLDAMAGQLRAKHGAKYGVFSSVVKASRAAIEKELIVKDEVVKGQIARAKIYGANGPIKVPKEVMLKGRVVIAELAKGVSFFELPPELQRLAANQVLSYESRNLFAEAPPKGEIWFDPDRHAGNFRFDAQTNTLVPAAFDFGQLIRITTQERSLILDLFALSQVAARTGAADWTANEIAGKLSLGEKQTQRLRKELRRYFPDLESGKEVRNYYALLAAMDTAGVEIKSQYFDFIRAIVQLSQYESALAKEFREMTPSERLERETLERVSKSVPRLQMSKFEKARFLLEATKGLSLSQRVSKVRSIVEANRNGMTVKTAAPVRTCEALFMPAR